MSRLHFRLIFFFGDRYWENLNLNNDEFYEMYKAEQQQRDIYIMWEFFKIFRNLNKFGKIWKNFD